MKYDTLYGLVLRDSPVFLETKSGKALGFSPFGEYIGTKDYAIVLKRLSHVEADDAEAFDITVERVLRYNPNSTLMLSFESGHILFHTSLVDSPSFVIGYFTATKNGTGMDLPVYNLRNRKEIRIS